ncbi:MAG: hypothetical protein ABIJ04_06785 [Bacteroidota bacterium]
MLDAEYDDLVGMLTGNREIPTRFFAFANTVATLNYQKDNYIHGWIGMPCSNSKRLAFWV